MGATSLLNVTGRAAGSAAWPTTDIAAMATSVAATVCARRNQGNRARFINASCPCEIRSQKLEAGRGPPSTLTLRVLQTSRSLAQVSGGRTRFRVGLVQGQHVDGKRDSDDVTIPLELAPCAIAARFRHVAFEGDRRPTESFGGGVEVFEGMGMDVVAHVLAQDERVTERAEIRLEIG